MLYKTVFAVVFFPTITEQDKEVRYFIEVYKDGNIRTIIPLSLEREPLKTRKTIVCPLKDLEVSVSIENELILRSKRLWVSDCTEGGVKCIISLKVPFRHVSTATKIVSFA